MGRWLIHANKGIFNVAIRGELGWTKYLHQNSNEKIVLCQENTST